MLGVVGTCCVRLHGPLGFQICNSPHPPPQKKNMNKQHCLWAASWTGELASLLHVAERVLVLTLTVLFLGVYDQPPLI